MWAHVWVVVALLAAPLAGSTAATAGGLPHTPGWYTRHGLKDPHAKKAEKKPSVPDSEAHHKTKTDKLHDMDALDAAEESIDHLVSIGKPKTMKVNPIKAMARPKTGKEAAAGHAGRKVAKAPKIGEYKIAQEYNKSVTPLASHMEEFNGVHDATEAILEDGDAKAHAEDAEKKLHELEKVAPARVTRVVKDPQAPSADVAAAEGLAGAQDIVKDIQQFQEKKKEKAADDLLTRQEAVTIKTREAARVAAKAKAAEEKASKAKEAAPKKEANLDELKKLAEMAHTAAVDSTPGKKHQQKKHKKIEAAH